MLSLLKCALPYTLLSMTANMSCSALQGHGPLRFGLPHELLLVDASLIASSAHLMMSVWLMMLLILKWLS
jgi:hypothetical protein